MSAVAPFVAPIACLYEGAKIAPTRDAVVDGEISLAHAQLMAYVEAAAVDLLRIAGPGARVGLCASNTWRHIVAYLAILRAGHVWVPLNPRNGRNLNATLQERAGLQLLLVDEPSADSVAVEPRGSVLLEHWLRDPSQQAAAVTTSASYTPQALRTTAGPGTARAPSAPLFPGCSPLDVLADPDAPAAIKFTGGSTGVPKGVVQSQRSMAAAIRSLRSFYEFTATDVNLAVAPLTHGASHYVLPVLAAGGCHVVLAQPDRTRILAELKHRVSIVFMPPTLIHLLMTEAAFGPEDLRCLRHLTYSAAPMAPAQIDMAIRRFGPRLSTLYGQTEAPMSITGLSPREMQRPELRTSVGRPFADTQVAVLTAQGNLRERDAVGEIVVAGDLADTYYMDAPEATLAARHETAARDWLRTGDIARIDAEGYVFLQGRAKELIITGGYNVYPAEVENVLASCPGVREVCAFGVPDEVWGERLEAAIAVDSTANDGRIDTDVLRGRVRAAIGAVRTPKHIHVLSGGLPRNAVGKIVRGDVRRLFYPAL